MQFRLSIKRRRLQRGQTLILAMLAIIIIAAAMVFLFDLQNVIRGKIKAQTAADSAALVGAKWQANSLNVIGELNIIKACTTLITDMPKTDSGDYSESPLWEPYWAQDLPHFAEVVRLISQMQVRASFVGPLIGYGAAQQAAKNNGLNYVQDYNEDLYMKYTYLSSSEGDLFYGEDMVKPSAHGYSWREPYAEMVRNILQPSGSNHGTGVAMAMNSDWVSDPELESDSDIFNSYLTDKSIYSAINANYWCALVGLLNSDFGSSKWWGNIELVLGENNFRYESELLPLKVRHFSRGWSIYKEAAITSGAFEGADSGDDRIMDNYNAPEGYDRPSTSKLLHYTYDNEHPFLCDENGEYLYDTDGNNLIYDGTIFDIEITGTGVNKLYYIDTDTGNIVYPGLYTKDTDEYWAPYPMIYWTVYDTSYWYSYADEDDDDWSKTWGTFLKSSFKDGYRYYGAVSCAGTLIEPTLISSRWNRLKLDSDTESEDDEYEYIGDAFEVGSEASGAGKELNVHARRLKSAEAAMSNNSVKDIEVISLAKPYGRIPVADGKYLTPCAISMVLPVFGTPQIIPVDLEKPADFTPDYKWSAFKREYLPLLGTVDSVDAMPALMAERYPDHWNAGWFTDYHNALVKLNNADWRQQGLDWLKTVIDEETGTTNQDTCDDWEGTGPGPRYAPSTPF